MLPPSAMAMMNGLSQGNSEAQSSLPSVYQPQGVSQPVNPFQGTIDQVVDQIMSLGQSINEQGQAYREIGVTFFKCAYELAKANERLNQTAEKGTEKANEGY
jgi:hypothetical protein